VVALAEPAAASACSDTTKGRLAIAVVLPRGGYGGAAAGPIVKEIALEARDLGYFKR
jgi:hypothetical protein